MDSTLCKTVVTAPLQPWTLSEDSTFVFYLPNGTAKYVKFGENVTVPAGTYLAFTGAISYTHWEAYTITGVSVGVTILNHSANMAGRVLFNYYAVTDPGNNLEVICGIASHANYVYQLTDSCTISAQMCAYSAELSGIAMEIPHAETIVTVVSNPNPNPTSVPLSLTGISFFTNAPNNPNIKYAPVGTPYNIRLGVKNDTTIDLNNPIYMTVNGGSIIQVDGSWAHGGLTYVTVPGLFTTGNDVICASFTEVSPSPGGILEWISAHPIETVAVSAVAAIGVVYLATRPKKIKMPNKTKR
jgi:hypothetical protein